MAKINWEHRLVLYSRCLQQLGKLFRLPRFCWLFLCVASLSSIFPLPSSLPSCFLTLPSLWLLVFFLLSLWGVKLYNYSCCKLPLISLVLFFFCCAVSRTASCWKYVFPSPPIESWCVISSWPHHHVLSFVIALDSVGPDPLKWLPLPPSVFLSSHLSLFRKKTPLVWWKCFNLNASSWPIKMISVYMHLHYFNYTKLCKPRLTKYSECHLVRQTKPKTKVMRIRCLHATVS